MIALICSFQIDTETLGNFAINIITTFIALILTFLLFRPKIAFSNKIAFCKEGEYKVKIENNSSFGFAGIYNIKAEMVFYRQQTNDKIRIKTKTIPLKKDQLFKLNSKRSKLFSLSPNYSYVFCTTSSFSKENESFKTAELLNSKKYDGIKFRVIATHSFSNITRTFEKIYLTDISKGQLENGTFKSGDTKMKIEPCSENDL